MQKWMRLAQLELRNMRDAKNTLKLAKALEEPLAMEKIRGGMPKRLPAGVSPEEFRQMNANEQLWDCAKTITRLRRGSELEPVVSDRAVAMYVSIFAKSQPEFEIAEGEGAEESIGRLCAAVRAWKEERMRVSAEMQAEAYSDVVDVKAAISGQARRRVRRGLSGVARSIEKSSAEAAGIVAHVFVMNKLAEILGTGQLNSLAYLASFGIDNAKRIMKLDSEIESAARGKGRGSKTGLMREKFGICCKKAVAELRAQSEIDKEERVWEGEAPAEGECGVFTAVRGNGRTETEDERRLRAEYPGLYKRIIHTLTKAELEARELKKEVRFAIREGVPAEFVRECVRMGIRDSEGIIDLYLASGKEMPAEKKEEAPAEMEPPRAKKVWGGRNRANGNNGAAEGSAENGRRQILNKGDIVGTIQLSDEARAHIRAAGLSPKDVLNSMIGGFNMGHKGNAAVGGAHFRGDNIRKNIRRYLAAEYRGRKTDAPDVDKLLDYLKSIEVVQEFGSSAYTRTKDDAMSINTNPGNEIGKDIITTVNAVLIELRNA